jgi:hypothetical protein
MIAESEKRQLELVVADLATEFPDVPHEVLVGLTRQAAERYETAKVKTFLSILVTKDVRALLRGDVYPPDVPVQAGPVPATPSDFQLAAGSST